MNSLRSMNARSIRPRVCLKRKRKESPKRILYTSLRMIKRMLLQVDLPTLTSFLMLHINYNSKICSITWPQNSRASLSFTVISQMRTWSLRTTMARPCLSCPLSRVIRGTRRARKQWLSLRSWCSRTSCSPIWQTSTRRALTMPSSLSRSNIASMTLPTWTTTVLEQLLCRPHPRVE